ncbi:polysaccharide biosynthesis protein [Flexistipes sinusarabici DSM 4947]|uniref:Polysaccharide biosynthesis protein n=1 Tax=Flexistipes sinusarabici (strain ATCC 49648 / DSM 4947 / MAS 10) TaxID=717231 RepID=F8E8J8_FLESM|nr:flippase [Flexistipes sinusarabici]AEI14047.1 polysaccharide biosynthesis protein [Flexistipes sinusarabici DSM 4947]
MVGNFIYHLKKKISFLDEHTLEVYSKSFASTIVKFSGTVIGLFVTILLSRTIGAGGLGIINLSNRIINILIIFGLLGMRQVIIKEVAIAYSKKNYSHIGNVMHTAYFFNGSITLIITISFILISPWMSYNLFNEPRLSYPLMIFLIALTPQMLSILFSSAFVGYRKIWQSNLVEQTLSIAITGLLLIFLWFSKYSLSIINVAICYAIGRIFVTVFVFFYWKLLYKYKSKRKLIVKKLAKTSLPLFVVSISGILLSNTDVIIMGIFRSAEEVGIYTIATRLAFLCVFFLQIANSSLAPKIASLYENNDIKQMEKMIQRVTVGLLFIGIFIFTVFVLFGDKILSIWGNEFVNAYWALVILSFGQMVNIGTGAIGTIMVMTGNEKVQSKVSLLFALLNVILCVFFVKSFGLIGAAISTALIFTFSNIVKVILVRKLVGINPLISFKEGL